MWFLINRLFKRTATGKAIKLIKLIIILPIVLLIVTIGLYTTLADSNPKKATTTKQSDEYIEFTDRPKNLSVMNNDGTVNGLNLLLIDNIATNGFVKEYLTIARNSQNGQLTDYPSHAPVETIIGLAMGEQGSYEQSGYILPNTCLPWDANSNSPLWQDGTEKTLAQATMPVFDKIGHNPNAWENGDYVGPYQQTASYFSSEYKPSKMNGSGMSSGRTTGDWSYFPDELAGIDYDYNYTPGIDLSKASDPVARKLLFSFNVSVGISWKTQFFGTYKGGDCSSGLAEMAKEYNTSFAKYQGAISKEVVDPSTYKWIGAFLLLEQGWNLNNRPEDSSSGKTSYQTMNSTNRSSCFNIFKLLGLGSTDAEYQSYLDSHVKEDPNNYGKCMRSVNQGTLWKDLGADGQMYTLVETNGDAFCSAFLGEIAYARMLKYAGVGVDPTNPSTYMNTVKQSGEWTPSGNTDWYKDAGIDTSKLNEKRAKIINEGHKVLGNPYIWGGTTWPNQNADGTFDIKTGGMDCSGFTSNVYQRALGVWIGRDTYAQIASPLLEKIDPSEAKPGDLMFNDSVGHVLIYLSGDPTQGPIAMHDPQTGDVIKISKYHAVSKVYRLKGIDS